MNDNLSYYIRQFFSDYLPHIRNLSPNTISTYNYSILVFIQMLKEKRINIDEMKVQDLNYDLIEEFIDWLRVVKKNSPTTINSRIACIKSFVCFLDTKNLNNFDSCLKIKNIKPLKSDIKFPEYLTIEEVSFLLNSINVKSKYQLKKLTMISLLYDAGLRVSELCQLKRKDILYRNKKITLHIEYSKNGRSRNLLISSDMEKIINEYLKEYRLNDEDYLFQSTSGHCYSRSGIYKMLKTIYEKAKENCNDSTMFQIKIHPHILRHSKATHLLDAGIDIIVIRDFLGHKWLKSAEIYMHVSNKKKEEILLSNSRNKVLSKKRSKREREDLETWLRTNC